MGFPLTGVDPADPVPGIIREIKYAQGVSSASGKTRSVVLVGNKTAAGTESTDKLGAVITGEDDAVERFGSNSELCLMFKSYVKVDPNAAVYAVAAPEGNGTAQVKFTFTGTASASTAVKIECIGDTLTVPVAQGDTATQVGDAVAAALANKSDWPIDFTTVAAAMGVVTIDAANSGVRHEHALFQIRMSMTKSATTAVTRSANTGATTDDDHGSAIAEIASGEFFYQVSPKTPDTWNNNAPAPSATDGGIGEHIAMVQEQSGPAFGKGQLVFFPMVGSAAQATSVATGSAANSVLAAFWHAPSCDWAPGMLSAHCTAVKRSKEVAHPGANLTDYGLGSGDVFQVPAPASASDKLSKSEVRQDLNNGITPIDWKPNGQAFIVRQITSRSLNGTVNDYRAREGHIPSAINYYWEQLFTRYFTSKQEFIADNPGEGEVPLANTTYPQDLKAIHRSLVNDLINFPGGPVLDPSHADAMIDSFECVRLADGLSCRSKPISVKHNNKAQFLIEESSEAY